jgi:hypothetical protein
LCDAIAANHIGRLAILYRNGLGTSSRLSAAVGGTPGDFTGPDREGLADSSAGILNLNGAISTKIDFITKIKVGIAAGGGTRCGNIEWGTGAVPKRDTTLHVGTAGKSNCLCSSAGGWNTGNYYQKKDGKKETHNKSGFKKMTPGGVQIYYKI